jgi:hypothetical protein
MYKKKGILFLGMIGWLVSCPGIGGEVMAQEETYELAHEEVFGELQRPLVVFPHDRHMDALDDQGCGACHHVFDKDEGVLVPVDDPVAGCTECHGANKEGGRPSLRQAFHGSCTVCHRGMKKGGASSGPITCGECHKK